MTEYNVSERIRYKMKLEDISIKSLATNIEISEYGLRKMLNTDDMKLSTLIKIADFFKLEAAYFLTPKDSTYQMQKSNTESDSLENEEELKKKIEELNSILDDKKLIIEMSQERNKQFAKSFSIIFFDILKINAENGIELLKELSKLPSFEIVQSYFETFAANNMDHINEVIDKGRKIKNEKKKNKK